MPIRKLNDRFVKSVKPTANRQVEYWDRGGRKGFGLRVSRTGVKTWVLRYRHNKIQRRLKLGDYPAMKLADARVAADEAKNVVNKGGDPFADRAKEKAAKTFAELADEYLERHAKPNKKTWAEDERILGKDLLPKWRHLKPTDIKRGDVRAMVESVADRGAPIHANRVLALVRKIFNFAIEREWLEANPCHLVKRPGKEQARDRVLTADEIRSFWAATEVEEPPIRDSFRLRLLTAQRGGEVLFMRWGDIDLDSGWWTIPAEVSKNGLSHHVPLSPQAVAILKELRTWQAKRLAEVNAGRAKKHEKEKEPSIWVFPSRWYEGEPLAWTRKATKRIRESCGVDFRPHDLRRTAASLMTGSGISRVVVQKILNHVETGVTAVYDRHSYDAEKRKALNAWGRQLQRILTAAKDNIVVPFETARAV